MLPSFDASQAQLTTYLYLGVRGAMQRMVNSHVREDAVRIEPDSVRLNCPLTAQAATAGPARRACSLSAQSRSTPISWRAARRRQTQACWRRTGLGTSCPQHSFHASTENPARSAFTNSDHGPGRLDASEFQGAAGAWHASWSWTERRLERRLSGRWTIALAAAGQRRPARQGRRQRPEDLRRLALAEAERAFREEAPAVRYEASAQA